MVDDLFFWASKLFWSLTSPDHLLLLLLTLGLLLSVRRRSEAPSRRQARGRRLCWSVLVLVWLIAVYPVGNSLLYPLEKRFPRPSLPPAERLAGVIVLGGAEQLYNSRQWGGLEVNEGGDRLLAMQQLLARYPAMRFIYSGGSGSITYRGESGALLVKDYLETLGLAHRVEFETRSRNTYENALFSRELMGSDAAGPWLLVTSAFHQPRSVGIFRQLGIEVIPYPTDYRSRARQGPHFDLAGNLKQLKTAVREWVGLLAYRVSGKTSSLLPAPSPVNSGTPDA